MIFTTLLAMLAHANMRDACRGSAVLEAEWIRNYGQASMVVPTEVVLSLGDDGYTIACFPRAPIDTILLDHPTEPLLRDWIKRHVILTPQATLVAYQHRTFGQTRLQLILYFAPQQPTEAQQPARRPLTAWERQWVLEDD